MAHRQSFGVASTRSTLRGLPAYSSRAPSIAGSETPSTPPPPFSDSASIAPSYNINASAVVNIWDLRPLESYPDVYDFSIGAGAESEDQPWLKWSIFARASDTALVKPNYPRYVGGDDVACTVAFSLSEPKHVSSINVVVSIVLSVLILPMLRYSVTCSCEESISQAVYRALKEIVPFLQALTSSTSLAYDEGMELFLLATTNTSFGFPFPPNLICWIRWLKKRRKAKGHYARRRLRVLYSPHLRRLEIQMGPSSMISPSSSSMESFSSDRLSRFILRSSRPATRALTL